MYHNKNELSHLALTTSAACSLIMLGIGFQVMIDLITQL